MLHLELLAPARNADIGIAAIDCGADAVYIGGPGYGARKDAGNSIDDIRTLCTHAHRFGARVFLTVNTLIYDGEMEEVHSMMLKAQKAGVDAFIVQDETIMLWEDITVPIHASTQCAIRTPERARHFESLGCGRIVLERELSLTRVRGIAESVGCEVECFVHGALCVCYSGQCFLSEYLDGRSANRGECIQACRSRYDLMDSKGHILEKDKALLSLKDLNLIRHLGELAEAGVCSFKIEGRLKNKSYVRNIVREYATALDNLVARHPDLYRRASHGTVREGFVPDPAKTFNRGYTELFLEGRRTRGWSSMDAPNSLGEYVGKVVDIKHLDRYDMEIVLRPEPGVTPLSNGDGFAFIGKSGAVGLRGDVCNGNRIRCKHTEGLGKGVELYRNLDVAFERYIDSQPCRRMLDVHLSLDICEGPALEAHAVSEDGRKLTVRSAVAEDTAHNSGRMLSMMQTALSRHEGIYRFVIDGLPEPGKALPLLSSASLNSLRRRIAEELDTQSCLMTPLSQGNRTSSDISGKELAEDIGRHTGELMRTKYCIRYELGICPVHQKSKQFGALFLVNNGHRLALGFDCARCEMTVKGA